MDVPVENDKKRRTHVIARIQQRICRGRKHVTFNSPQLEESGGSSSSVTGHVVSHPVHTVITSSPERFGHHGRAEHERVRPRTQYTTTSGERARALSPLRSLRCDCDRPARSYLPFPRRRCASQRTRRYASRLARGGGEGIHSLHCPKPCCLHCCLTALLY